MTKARVLVVEPDNLVRHAILNDAHSPNHEMYGVATLEHALEEIECGFIPVVMLIDQLEWELSEETLQRRIKKYLRADQLMLLVDEQASRSSKIASFELDPGDLVTKPFHPQELKYRLGSLIYMVRRQ